MRMTSETNQASDAVMVAKHTELLFKQADVNQHMGEIINEAISENHFYMVYQPQFALGSGKLLGF